MAKKKNKELFNVEQFMRGISAVESGSGKYMKNPTSSASGLYQQLYNSIPQDFLDQYDISDRDAFIADTSAQNAYMLQRISGDMSNHPRRTNLLTDAYDLEKEYKPQLGSKFRYRTDELSALSHFLGRSGARKHLAGIRDDKPYTPPGINKTPKEYLRTYNKAIGMDKKPGRAGFELEQGGNIMAKKKKTSLEQQSKGISDEWDVGTPLAIVHAVPAGQSDYTNLMSGKGSARAQDRMRFANLHGNYIETPGQPAGSFDFNNPGIQRLMKEKGLTRDYVNSYHPNNYLTTLTPQQTREKYQTALNEFGEGGWLGENAGMIGSVIGGAAGMFVGNPGAGAAIGGMIGNAFEPGVGEIAEQYNVPTSLARQHYQRAEDGLNLNQNYKGITRYNGPEHNQGGIPLDGLGVEVEGGETRTGDMVHSDNIKITKDMVNRYPVLKKSDKGKTMAQITSRVHKKFEKRKWDEMNDNAAELTMMPYEQISDQLSNENIPPGTSRGLKLRSKASGGDISADKARMILSHGRVRGRPITDRQRRFFGANTKAANGLDLGAAPLIAGGVNLFSSFMDQPEEVDYGKVSYSPTRVNTISADSGIQRIRQTFGNAESKLRRLNPNRYMARMSDMAAQEAGAVTNYAGGIQAKNADAINRAYQTDAQLGTRTNMINAQIGMQEAEANAANRATRDSRIERNFNNLGTMMGQKARDDKMYSMQEDYNTGMLGIMQGYLDLQKEPNSALRPNQQPPVFQRQSLNGYYANPDMIPDLQAEEGLFGEGTQLPNQFNYNIPRASGGSLSHRLRLRAF